MFIVPKYEVLAVSFSSAIGWQILSLISIGLLGLLQSVISGTYIQIIVPGGVVIVARA